LKKIIWDRKNQNREEDLDLPVFAAIIAYVTTTTISTIR
jgi:hypothetical protein